MVDGATKPLFAALLAHYEDLLAFVRRKVRCPATAADVMQDIYIRLASRSSSEEVANPRAFVYRIAGNLAIDHLRLERGRARYVTAEPVPDHLPDPNPSAEAIADAKRRLALLADAVAELPPRCREVFVLRKFEELEQHEIARRLGISRNMVEKHLRKALLHCALRLREHD